MRIHSYRAVMATTAALVLMGCAKGPESTVENFYAAVGKGDIAEAEQYLSSQILGYMPPAKLEGSLKKEHERVVACGGIKAVTVKLEGEGESRSGMATVSYRGECPEKTEKVYLVREQDQWKIGADK